MSSRIYEVIKEEGSLEEQIKKILKMGVLADSSEILAYFLRKTMDVFKEDPSIHHYLLNRIPSELITRFVPGLLSFYFSLLKDQKTNRRTERMVIDSIKHVLESAARLNDVAEARIHEFFYFRRGPMFEEIYKICAQKFKTSRRVFFISELLLLGYPLEDSDYDAINEGIEEIFSLELIRKLLDREKYRNNEEIFEKLIQMYKKGEDVSDIILRIQETCGVVCRVPELCVVNKETTRTVLDTNDLRKIEMFLRNATDVPLHVEVIGKYLELCDSPKQVLGSDVWKRLNVRKVVSENYDELLEYAFNKLKTSPRILINLIGIEFRPKLEDFILQSIEFVSRCSDAKDLSLYLYFLKVVVEKNFLRRSILRRIFDGLIYLDNEDYRVRCMKYEVLGELFVQYSLLDKAIEHSRHLNESQKTWNVECTCSIPENIFERVDTRDVDEDNVNVLAAIAWDELTIVPAEGELMAVSVFLKKIIDSTGMFYENRISKSNFILHLVDLHGISRFNETKRRLMDEFFQLLGSIVRFSLSKKLLSKMFLISLDYFHIFDTSCLIRSIVRNDRYYCLFIFYNLAKNKEKTLSKKLLEFLKKSLRESQES
ncbi:uncharacterized protein Eint_080560 [Encephalitozoon intestinalis ATCC 50506]|uniref:Uncharacterized protein n=1 Tax=Encephalitozoon intestinalis (strain ATCC 50506) TaxID=876142 RepID=E0S8J7_ENCIT|nr:uncharacterized protein Eint_080560 [Encephalitozoon intestinalis ATCC 50506]ADM11991.1 hypothetical protein Eint_080560 [Encephalitozoon intestinalis ATCC 50506]UTX45778.1 hypothetical protein GPK93_08g13540 [Encephalitozoon intestinalis]